MARNRWAARAWAIVLGAILVSGGAEARQVAGVQMPDTLDLQGRRLALAHMALKEKLFFDVYVWGLYMEQIPRAESEAIASNHLKRLHFRFLRKVRRDQLVEAMRHGLSRNADLNSAAMQPQLEALLQSLKDVRKGEDLVITYLPDTGLEISGGASGGAFIPGKSFADALFSVWLEANPIFPR